MSAASAPNIILYVPAAVSQADVASLNDANVYLSTDIVRVCDSPGASSLVFAKPFNSNAGFSSPPDGAVTYSWTASLPATEPVFFTVMLAVKPSADGFMTGLLYSNSVYDFPYPNGYETLVSVLWKYLYPT